jgi:HAD superfamily hydrolase (TIGR01509 family)
MIMKFKGVVFDFNGTLFWDTQLHNKAWDIFLLNNGIRISDQEKYEKIHGRNNKDILDSLFSYALSKEENTRFSHEKERIYHELCLQTHMELAPGAREFLLFLKKNNIKFTIATASEVINVDFYFKHLGLDTFFDYKKVIFNDGTIPGKPNPQIFTKAMDVIGISNKETVIFEDSVAGIMAAENANAGEIIIVDSNSDDYSRWNYQTIHDFSAVDRSLFL